MKRKGLYFLIALALGGVGAVHAQDTAAASDSAASTMAPSYDGRWYIAPTVGGYYNDTDRNTHSRQFYYGLGVGRFISPNTSIDLFIDRTSRSRDGGGKWSNNNYGVAARYYFGEWTAWRPYLMAAVMGSNHHNAMDKGWAPAAQIGAGLSKAITDSSDFRVEAGYRYDWDDKSQPSQNGYGDWILGFSIVSRFGEPAAAPAPVAPPPPAAPDCSTLDGDHDGVNNCDDKCPNTPAGTIVGPDGCPQKVVIDLRGVNFKFDRPKKGETDISKSLAEPTSASLATLDQAVDTLNRYPNVKVMVAGYTDSKGTDAYNQKLSERRAQIVYNYLTSHGIDASRLEGPVGHGESDPIGDNSTDAGRAQNRRTELQVQQ
ncbi:OmpA family protein [Rhodanobacter glycinis]|uniref:OmpA-OmpF porin, OOP family n=1 Tax=Rhodanobacter glycinis TaxID=582702 RepID=A0A1I4E8K2_9GAMM|nr:OmpA family protein [Rhodanobacter glycinis]SFL02075.1 OmpA-OmpF porin, OOP family [Rhodanobacter glycinis]